MRELTAFERVNHITRDSQVVPSQARHGWRPAFKATATKRRTERCSLASEGMAPAL
jgi:hypothetical protein